jgi:hypothetical protein
MSETSTSETLRNRWCKRLRDEESAHKHFRDEAQRAMEAYLAEQPGNGASAKAYPYPLFWSTVKVLHGRIYAQPPKPDVRKRYKDAPAQKPVSQAEVIDENKLALAIERSLTYTIDTTGFDADGHASVNDYIVTGLGQAKIEMHTETAVVPVMDPLSGQPILDEEGQPITQTVIKSQKVKLRAFSWKQFRWEPNQHWDNVSWVAFDHWMTADQIKEQFDVTMQRDVTSGETSPAPDKPEAAKYKSLHRVSEVWDKERRKVIFVTDDHTDVLEEREDKLGLEDFFPCPRPMMLNVKGDDLVPKPDYTFCASLFEYVNSLTTRIMALTRQVKDIGFYDASFQELSALVTKNDGDLIPITDLAAKIAAIGTVGRSGYDAVVAKQDNTGKVTVLQELMALREAAKANIWETYGVADIQRGATNPNETATAQRIKADWTNVRVGERIRGVALFFRDVFRIMAEIIAEHFQPDQLYAMTGLQLNEAEMRILRSDLGRCYAIDVESDSTVVQDESAEKEQRMEFLGAITSYIEKMLPAIQQNILPADLGKELLLFAVNTFKNGRQLEDAINALPDTAQQLTQLTQQNQQAQQENQQLQQQVQEQGQQLQQVNAGKEQRENIKTMTGAQKTAADTQRTQVETALIAEEAQGKAQENAIRRVAPFQRQGAPRE